MTVNRRRRLLAGLAVLLVAGVEIYRTTGAGTLVLGVEPGVRVLIDGRVVTPTLPRDEIALPAGRHSLWVEKSGHVAYTDEFDVRRGDRIERVVRMVPLTPPHSIGISAGF